MWKSKRKVFPKSIFRENHSYIYQFLEPSYFVAEDIAKQNQWFIWITSAAVLYLRFTLSNSSKYKHLSTTLKFEQK